MGAGINSSVSAVAHSRSAANAVQREQQKAKNRKKMCFMDIKEWMLRGDKSVEILFVGFVARVFVRWLSSHNFSTEKPDAKIHLFVSRPRRDRGF